ncbi:BglG family transcription antiterminator LicT [uncultured Clostridium sp.]|uniref:BglG family transcription antiterminator LicT n=1 Tax=uncultured Clostridium sp. TaxID=59620 RepID=UPI0028E473BC|nr:PRD domain-containing protein [uncultured Clostridium sp.]
MVIKKIFNNNAVLVKDIDKKEIVLIGSGIAFKKRIGDIVDRELIEKTFTLKEEGATEKFKILLDNIPTEHITMCYDIIEYAKNKLNTELSDYIYVTLTDHVNYALKLLDEGLNRPNVLIWEVKKFYPKEFQIGLKALDIIEEKTGKRLPNDEAGSITLHLINAQLNTNYENIKDITKIAKMIGDIINIVKYTYNAQIDESSLEYDRFITHLRFFFRRLNNKTKKENTEDDFLLKQVKEKYKDAYSCMRKVEKYLETNLGDEEKLYLTLHIQRLTNK